MEFADQYKNSNQLNSLTTPEQLLTAGIGGVVTGLVFYFDIGNWRPIRNGNHR